ncbi:hypothetical protein [Saccharopolyspora hattusasensis]|uniref:hypothetical protein n=1 Tax=Saccharopolyspora hattusasensis TaxID=1128679 RepID=UPI003D97CE3A
MSTCWWRTPAGTSWAEIRRLAVRSTSVPFAKVSAMLWSVSTCVVMSLSHNTSTTLAKRCHVSGL